MQNSYNWKTYWSQELLCLLSLPCSFAHYHSCCIRTEDLNVGWMCNFKWQKHWCSCHFLVLGNMFDLNAEPSLCMLSLAARWQPQPILQHDSVSLRRNRLRAKIQHHGQQHRTPGLWLVAFMQRIYSLFIYFYFKRGGVKVHSKFCMLSTHHFHFQSFDNSCLNILYGIYGAKHHPPRY